MGKKRDAIRMSDDERWRFIEQRKSIQVATNGPDGWPHLVTMWFAIDDGEIVLETFTKSQKIKNLERDSRITVLVESGEEYEELKAVVIYGHGELISDVDEVHRLHVAVLRRNNSKGYPDELLEEVSAGMAAKKTAIRVKPVKIVSWDHTKLDAGVY